MKNHPKSSIAGVSVLLAVILCFLPFTATAQNTTAAPFTADLTDHDPALFQMSNGWSNGGFFFCTWRATQVSFENGIMTLTVAPDAAGTKPPYQSGEYRTAGFYGYGRYEVRMKAAKGSGLVSSFFTYTGPSDKKPWDEIDIEFLGKDTTKMQANYFTNGVGGHERLVDLGFDASADFHQYAIEWLPGAINWYVDGTLVYSAKGKPKSMPTNPGKIMVNLWPGTGVDSLLGPFDPAILPVTAQYDSISFTPAEK